MSMAEIGHNREQDEKDRNALFGYLVRQEQASIDAIAAEKAKQVENLKKGKEWGFSKEEITFCVKARAAGDGSTIVQKHDIHNKVLIKLGLIPDARGGDLFVDRADRLQLITAKGHSDGLTGHDCVSNYPGGSDEDRTYIDGWKAGQKEFADNWQAAMERKIAAANKESPPPADPFPTTQPTIQ